MIPPILRFVSCSGKPNEEEEKETPKSGPQFGPSAQVPRFVRAPSGSRQGPARLAGPGVHQLLQQPEDRPPRRQQRRPAQRQRGLEAPIGAER